MATAVAVARLADEDLAQLRGLTEEWVQLSLRADWDALVALLTEDAVFLPPDQPIVEGKPAVREWFEAYPPINAFTSSLVAAEGKPDLAWGRGRFAMTVEPAPGQAVAMQGKWAATYRKRGDGGWLCASLTWNLDAPLAAG
jgi:ketosteroid isomerase-like protein